MTLDNQVGDFMLSENDISGKDFPYGCKGAFDVVELTWIAIDEVSIALLDAGIKR